VIWEYAKANGFTILTADSDFLKLAWQRGTPPKVIRIERCDFKTVIVERLLRGNAIRLAQFEESDQGTLKLSLG
jgi:predicted nuclease of predicted toxin-antitoxin system